MPRPCNYLVPAVVLMNNPGVTREEYLQLLLDTPGTGFFDPRINKHDDWNMGKKPYRDSRLYEGLNGLADMLSIKYSEQFSDSYEENHNRKDKNGLEIRMPELNVFNPESIFSAHLSFDNAREYVLFEEGMFKFVVREHVKNRLLESGGHEEVISIHKYQSEEALIEDWPECDTDFIYDWSQESGFWREDNFTRTLKYLRWVQKDGKFYFDIDNWRRMPSSILDAKDEADRGIISEDCIGEGYTDLMCTATAIDIGATKLMGAHQMRGDRETLEKFLDDFPEARDRVEKANSDAWTYRFAERNGKNYTDTIRAVLHNKANLPGDIIAYAFDKNKGHW